MKKLSIGQKAAIAVLAGNSIFGFSFLFSKLALDLTIPAVLIAIRFAVAFLVLNVIVLIGKNVRRADGKTLISFSLKGKPIKDVLLLSLFQPVIYFAAESNGIVYTSSAFAGTIIAVIPIAGIALDVLLMHEKVRPRQIVCAFASVLGVIVTTIGATNMKSSAKGTAFLIVAVIAGALFYVFSKKSGSHYSALERTYVMFGVGSVFYIVAAVVQCWGRYEELVEPAVTKPIFWIGVLYLSVLSSVVAFLLLNFGANHVSVARASLYANFTTVISILAGVIFLKESFTWPQIVGAVIILVSVTVGA